MLYVHLCMVIDGGLVQFIHPLVTRPAGCFWSTTGIPSHKSGIWRNVPGLLEIPRFKQKSHGSSRATSRASGATFDLVGEFVKKFADDAKSCEQRDVDERTRLLEEARQRESKSFHQVTSLGKSTLDFMQDLIRKENDLALEREKEIRENMKQLAAM